MKNIISRHPTFHGLSLPKFLSESTQIHLFVNPANTNQQTNQGKNITSRTKAKTTTETRNTAESTKSLSSSYAANKQAVGH